MSLSVSHTHAPCVGAQRMLCCYSSRRSLVAFWALAAPISKMRRVHSKKGHVVPHGAGQATDLDTDTQGKGGRSQSPKS